MNRNTSDTGRRIQLVRLVHGPEGTRRLSSEVPSDTYVKSGGLFSAYLNERVRRNEEGEAQIRGLSRGYFSSAVRVVVRSAKRFGNYLGRQIHWQEGQE